MNECYIVSESHRVQCKICVHILYIFFFATESVKSSREPVTSPKWWAPGSLTFCRHRQSSGVLVSSKPHCFVWHPLTKHSQSILKCVVHVNTHFTWVNSRAIQNTSFLYFGIVYILVTLLKWLLSVFIFMWQLVTSERYLWLICSSVSGCCCEH